MGDDRDLNCSGHDFFTGLKKEISRKRGQVMTEEKKGTPEIMSTRVQSLPVIVEPTIIYEPEVEDDFSDYSHLKDPRLSKHLSNLCDAVAGSPQRVYGTCPTADDLNASARSIKLVFPALLSYLSAGYSPAFDANTRLELIKLKSAAVTHLEQAVIMHSRNSAAAVNSEFNQAHSNITKIISTVSEVVTDYRDHRQYR